MLCRCWKPSDRLLWIQSDYSCCPLPASCTLPGSPLKHAGRQRLMRRASGLFSAKKKKKKPQVCPFAQAYHITHNNVIINTTWSVDLLLVTWGGSSGFVFLVPCSVVLGVGFLACRGKLLKSWWAEKMNVLIILKWFYYHFYIHISENILNGPQRRRWINSCDPDWAWNWTTL